MTATRLPDFLIIGAMKSGTTGLFFDLCSHPRVFLPENKEPTRLVSDDVLTTEGKQHYAELYAAARDDELIGDASTGYTKLPNNPGVAERAVAVLEPGFRAIYIVRDPIDRIVSQHYHEFSCGLVGPDINQAVREHARFVEFSRYAWQLRPWLEALGRERICIELFENYKADRGQVVTRVCKFLGLDPAELPAVDDAKVFNAGDAKPVLNSFWTQVRQHALYRKLLRPLVSMRARHHLRKWFMPKAPPRPPAPTADTVAWLAEQLAEDRRELESLVGELPWPTRLHGTTAPQ